MKDAPRLVFACGGTGGHIFPAFSVAQELKKKFPAARILYVCGKKDIVLEIFRSLASEKVVVMESASFRGVLSLLNPVFLLKLLIGFSQAFRLLVRERPHLVVGYGGYFSFPVVLIAKGLNIRTMIHEQNVVPGAANAFLLRLADAAALSFPETRRQLPAHRNLRVTGNPIREFIEACPPGEGLSFFGFSPDKITLLVLGGSQGAESINTFFLEALPFLSENTKQRLQVLHLCGRMPVSEAEAALARQGVKARAFSFFDRMDLVYSVADISIGRAGATFLAEIKAKNIPAILVPYPFGNGHQKVNAEVFCSEDADSKFVEQKDLTAERLASLIESMLATAGRRQASSGARSSDPARPALADFISEFLPT